MRGASPPRAGALAPGNPAAHRGACRGTCAGELVRRCVPRGQDAASDRELPWAHARGPEEELWVRLSGRGRGATGDRGAGPRGPRVRRSGNGGGGGGERGAWRAAGEDGAERDEVEMSVTGHPRRGRNLSPRGDAVDGPQLDKPWRLHPASSRVLPRGPDGAQSPDARPHRSQHLSGGVASAEPSGCNPQDLTEKTDAPGKSLPTCRRPWLVSGGGTCIKVPENLGDSRSGLSPSCRLRLGSAEADRRSGQGAAWAQPWGTPARPAEPGPQTHGPKRGSPHCLPVSQT